MILVPKIIKALGPRGFTSLTNTSNALGFIVSGLPIPNYSVGCWLGLLLHSIGVNNTSAAACKAMAIDRAVADGFGRGEYGGYYSSCRTLSMIVAPIVYGWAYTKASSPG